jgi:hypothetical protein
MEETNRLEGGWEAPAHLARLFLRGPNAGQILDARVGSCPFPKSSSLAHHSYRTMTLAANFDPREKRYSGKVIGAR